MYAVYRTAKFDKEFSKKLSNEEQKEVENLEKNQLTDNPYTGDPLGYRFFREKKLGGKRVYFLVYDDLKAVLMIAISDKRTQQDTINEIKNMLKDYYFIVKDAIKQHGGYGHV